MSKAHSPKVAKTQRAAPTPASRVSERPPLSSRTGAIHDAVDTVFQADADVRDALARNLEGRTTAAQAFASRAQQAFATFNPTKYPSPARARPHYVKPGDSATATQQHVIEQGVAAFRSSTTPRSMKIVPSTELQKLIQEPPANGDAIIGTIRLPDFMRYIEDKSETGSFIARDAAITVCKAEIEAERRLQVILHSQDTPAAPVTTDTPSATGHADAAHLTSTKLVKDHVDLQMGTATSPESRLRYAVAAPGDQLTAVHANVDTFELRSGPSDVTSFHDFHNLQIAFEDVWTELFDHQLGDLGRQLYEEYVRFKSSTGVDDGEDLPVNTIDDLRHLMEKIRDFSRLTADNIPPGLQPPAQGGATPDNAQGNAGNVIADVVRVVLDPVGAVVKLLGNAFRQQGVLTWASFKAPLQLGDTIEYATTPLPANENPGGHHVRIVFERGTTYVGAKNLRFFADGKPFTIIQVNDWDPAPFMLLPASMMKTGVLEFGKHTGAGIYGVYVLGGLDEVLTAGTSVTFTWTHDT